MGYILKSNMADPEVSDTVSETIPGPIYFMHAQIIKVLS